MLRWWSACLKADRGLLDVTPAMIESWAASEQRRGLSKRTVNSQLSTLVGFYRWAHAQGHADRDIGSAIRRPKNPRRSVQRWLGREQLLAFLDAARDTSPLAHSLTCLWALNGLRLDETLAIRIEHIEHIDDLPVLWLPKRKLEHADRVGLPTRTHAAMQVLARGRERGLLHTVGGKKLTSTQVYNLLNRVSEISGVGFHVRPHMLRATFITLSLEAGVNVVDVMNSAGHSSLSMVSYYDRGYRSVTRNASIPLTAWIES